MKFFYVFVFNCFLLNGLAQDLKIGFVDEDVVLAGMQEFQYLDSMRILVNENNCKLGELMIGNLQIKYAEMMRRISCSSPIMQQKAEEELQRDQQSILDLEIEINKSDSLYKEAIISYCKKIMNGKMRVFVKKKGIHLLLDENVIIYAENKIVFTDELIFLFKNREKNEWNNDELVGLSTSLNAQYDIFSEKLKDIIKLVFKSL